MLTPDPWSELSPPKVAVDFAAEDAEDADIAARCKDNRTEDQYG